MAASMAEIRFSRVNKRKPSQRRRAPAASSVVRVEYRPFDLLDAGHGGGEAAGLGHEAK
jgi:hypothetical protein